MEEGKKELSKYHLAKLYFKEAFKYAELIQKHCTNKSVEDFQKSPPMQNMAIYCLKMIGTYVDLSAEALGINFSEKTQAKGQKRDATLFLKNLHFLRNRFIHHMDSNMSKSHTMKGAEVEFLQQICVRKVGQLAFFLRALGTQGDPAKFDLKGQKYKIFFDIHDLGDLLYKNNPREKRGKIPQSRYLQGLLNAIRSINLLVPIKNMSEDVIDYMSKSKPVDYYAVLNLLDNIAVMGNPNAKGATQLISNSAREKLINCEKKIDHWMRDLGDDRNKSNHGGGKSENVDVAENIIHLRVIHDVLLSEKFGDLLGKQLSTKEVPSPQKYLTFKAKANKDQPKKKVLSAYQAAAKKQNNNKQKPKSSGKKGAKLPKKYFK